jgi:hypothetical protein
VQGKVSIAAPHLTGVLTARGSVPSCCPITILIRGIGNPSAYLLNSFTYGKAGQAWLSYFLFLVLYRQNSFQALHYQFDAISTFLMAGFVNHETICFAEDFYYILIKGRQAWLSRVCIYRKHQT